MGSPGAAVEFKGFKTFKRFMKLYNLKRLMNE
jgi:hypothetical protein